MFDLRDGTQTSDHRLDRLIDFDERSREFPISAVIPEEITRGRGWRCPTWLDQGQEGACVGFGISHELSASPVIVPGVNYASALSIYNDAKKIDPWPGEDYSGTSVLAGCKVAQSRGYFDSYRWCFSIDDILRALTHSGPVVVGSNWKDSMFDTRPSGLLDLSGSVAGGHCYLIRGFSLVKRLAGEGAPVPMFRIRNSWGKDWGVEGDAYMRIDDFERELLPDADSVVFVGRHRP